MPVRRWVLATMGLSVATVVVTRLIPRSAAPSAPAGPHAVDTTPVPDAHPRPNPRPARRTDSPGVPETPFTVAGSALAEGHVFLEEIAFPSPSSATPVAWGRDDASAARPGTIVLILDEVVNSHPEDVTVCMDPGYGPTGDGFTLAVSCAAPGAYRVSGRFRVT